MYRKGEKGGSCKVVLPPTRNLSGHALSRVLAAVHCSSSPPLHMRTVHSHEARAGRGRSRLHSAHSVSFAISSPSLSPYFIRPLCRPVRLSWSFFAFLGLSSSSFAFLRLPSPLRHEIELTTCVRVPFATCRGIRKHPMTTILLYCMVLFLMAHAGGRAGWGSGPAVLLDIHRRLRRGRHPDHRVLQHVRQRVVSSLSACCQHLVSASPARCQRVVSSLSARCQHAAGVFSRRDQHVASVLSGCGRRAGSTWSQWSQCRRLATKIRCPSCCASQNV